MTIKNVDTDIPVFKAIFVARGHPDKDEYLSVNKYTNLRQYYTPVISSISKIHWFCNWKKVVIQIYLNSPEGLYRKVYLRPLHKLRRTGDSILKLFMTLYGIPYSRDYFNSKMAAHIKEYLLNFWASDRHGYLSVFKIRLITKIDTILRWWYNTLRKWRVYSFFTTNAW